MLTVPWVLAGFLCFGISAILWLAVVSRVPLSYAYPMVALSYVLIFGASYVWFGEALGALRVAGAALICFGVVLVARS